MASKKYTQEVLVPKNATGGKMKVIIVDYVSQASLKEFSHRDVVPRVGEFIELDREGDKYHTAEYEVRSVTYTDNLQRAVLTVTLR